MTTRSEGLSEQGRLRFVAVLAGAIADGMKLEEWFALLDDELRALAPRREAFERELAEAWFEQQAKTLQARKPRNTAARRRRELLAELAAAEQP